MKIEENRKPEGFKENYEKQKKINNKILEVWKRVMKKWTPDELNKTNYSKYIGVLGVILLVIGLILQYSVFSLITA